MQSQVLNSLNKQEKSFQVIEDNQNQITQECLEEFVEEEDDHHHHHQNHKHHRRNSQNLETSEDLKALQRGHQTRRVFIQGKNVSEFVLILKMKLQVKSVQVEGEHGCVSFKNPVKTDLILDLYGNSSLKLQLYLSRRSKGTFRSFFSQKSQIQSSQQILSSSSQLSSSSSSQTSQSLSQKSEQQQLTSESSLLSSASTEYIKALLQQQQQKQKEELINLFKQHYHEVSNPWQQEQISYQKKLRAVFKRITELIGVEAIYSYLEFKNKLLNEGFEYEDIMTVFGSRKPEIDNLIEIFSPYKVNELKTMTTCCIDTMNVNSINSKSNQLSEEALSQFTNDDGNNQAIIIDESDKSPNNKSRGPFKKCVDQQITAEKGFIKRYQQAREDRKSRSPFMSKEEQILSKSRSRSPTPLCHQAAGDLFKY